MVNDLALDRGFHALSHPIRRCILERLAVAPATVGEVTRGIPVSKPAISKHLKVLEDARLVVRVVHGRTHHLALDEEALSDAAGWIARQRAVWERKFAVVEQFLEEQGSP